MGAGIWLQVAIWAIFSPIVGGLIGAKRGRPEFGVFLGFLLGPIGWLIVWLSTPVGPKCPHCGGQIEAGYTVCRHCGRDLPQRQTP